jgi:hypothetical protein
MWSEERESMEGPVFLFFLLPLRWMSNEGRMDGGAKLARVIKS